MSLTNTDPRKTDLFAKFDWPRVSCPYIDFSLPESEREKDVISREKKAAQEIQSWIAKRKIDICAIIIEPIQGEGGDNHFRGEWLKKLREICDENDILLIFDEVQTGIGNDRQNVVLPAFRRVARSDGVRKEGAGLRHHGRAASR